MKLCPNYGRSDIRQQVPRHPGAGRDPCFRSTGWIPACAGMTEIAEALAGNMNNLASNETQP